MAWVLVVKLLDALPEIGLNHLDSNRRHVVPKAAFFGQHRFAFDQRLCTMVAQDAVHDLVVFGRVAGPMHLDPI
jgi:hypothetical protein